MRELDDLLPRRVRKRPTADEDTPQLVHPAVSCERRKLHGYSSINWVATNYRVQQIAASNKLHNNKLFFFRIIVFSLSPSPPLSSLVFSLSLRAHDVRVRGVENSNAPPPPETFSHFGEQCRCHHRSCIFPPLVRGDSPRKPERREEDRGRLFLSFPTQRRETEDECRGLAASVVTSANPIVDNLRLIVPVTRQAHTLVRDTREER